MKFMLMFFDTDAQQSHNAELTQTLHAAWGAYAGAMGQAGVIVAVVRLCSPWPATITPAWPIAPA